MPNHGGGHADRGRAVGGTLVVHPRLRGGLHELRRSVRSSKVLRVFAVSDVESVSAFDDGADEVPRFGCVSEPGDGDLDGVSIL